MKIIKNLMLLIFAIMIMKIAYANKPFLGSISPIPQDIQKMMIGHSWHEGCPVKLDQLAYLKIPYWGFDDKPHIGELIVNTIIAKQTLNIFNKLFAAHFPIEKMLIPEHAMGSKKNQSAVELALNSDNTNNTNAFFCRIDGQDPKNFSPHSWGIAIDINPFYNPAVIAQQYMSLQNGRKYLNRKLQHIGMIRSTDNILNIFLSHGWGWGGYYKDEPDYMHFQKMIAGYYLINSMEYIPPGSSLLDPKISSC